MVKSHASAVISQSFWLREPPTLLTRTSIRPCVAAMRANASSTAASSVTSGQALRRLCQLRPVEIEQRQRRPFLGEALRNRGPDAVGGTSDNDKFVLHAIHARRLLGLTCKANQAGCGGNRRAALE